jgi:hypothetical protein
MNASHVNAAQLAALNARTVTPLAPARILYRPAAGPLYRWELHLPSGATYPRATFAECFSALAALAPGLDLAMSPAATTTARAELVNATRLAHIDEEPARWLVSTPAHADAYSLDAAQALLHAAQRGAPVTMSPDAALELWHALALSRPFTLPPSSGPTP